MVSGRSDVFGGVLSTALGIGLLSWLIPVWVEPDPDLRLPVSLVPQVIAIGFVVCGVMLVLSTLFNRSSDTDKSHTLAQQPSGASFDANELRGLCVLIALLVLSTFAFQWFHFLFVAPLIVAVTMWMYGPLRFWSLLLTTTAGPLLIWFIATQVLGRVLP